MKKEFKKEDVFALDFILGELVSGKISAVTVDYLQQPEFLKLKRSKRVAVFEYYAEILESHGCCSINRKMKDDWILGPGGNIRFINNNGGFKAIYEQSLKENEKKEIYDKAVLEELQLQINTLKRNKNLPVIAIIISILSVISSVLLRYI
jgi:hypothetical protein